MNNKILFTGILVSILVLTSTSNAYAHISVKPTTVGVGSYQTFTVGVPLEKDQPTTTVRLVIPEGLENVTPNVKPGWKIELKKAGEGDEAKVTEIVWTEGEIPPGQRDDFLFSAKTPAKESALQWKAYQTYKDGTIVSWDQAPKESKDAADEGPENTGPYSVTKIVNDLTNATPETENKINNQSSVTTIVPYAALLLSAISLALTLRKKA
jgi:uncharacterized protein YcnI